MPTRTGPVRRKTQTGATGQPAARTAAPGPSGRAPRANQPAAAAQPPPRPAGPVRPGALQWEARAREESARTGVPADVFLSLIQAESAGNPNIVGDRGASVGLFQLHERGVGYGYSVEQRQDPELQFRLMSPRITNAYRQATAEGLTGREAIIRTGQLAERPAAGAELNYGIAYDRISAYRRGEAPAVASSASYTAPAARGSVSQSRPMVPASVAAVAAGAAAPLAAQRAAAFGAIVSGAGALPTATASSAAPRPGDDVVTLFRVGTIPVNVNRSAAKRGAQTAGALVGGGLLVLVGLGWAALVAARSAGAKRVTGALRSIAGD